jgi:pilus assembly protein CpaD
MTRLHALRLAGAVSAAALAVTFLAACDHARIADDSHPRLTDHTRRHPVVVMAETATLDVVAAPADKGTEARVLVETTRFMRNYRYEGRGPLRIAVPRGAGRGMEGRVHALRQVAWRNGVPPDRIRVVGKPGGGPVTLSYDRIAAVGPTCGDWSEDVTRNPQNLPYPNYGCATQRNLAAMAANPTDLMYPAIETPRGSDTRAADNKNFNQNIGQPIKDAGTTSAR